MRAMKEDDRGFTLIELLVVVLIIGILAAIAIPVFLGQQTQAKDAAAKSDLANAKIAMVAYGTGHSGTYLGVSNAATTKAALASYGYAQTSATNGVSVKTSDSAGTYCLQVTSDSSSTTNFKITDSTGAVSGIC